MKKNTRKKQTLEQQEDQQRKKTKLEVLDADQHISKYNNNLDNLIDIFTRYEREDDFTQNLMTTSKLSKIQKIHDLSLDTFKAESFSLGPKVENGDFSQGDQIQKIISVKKSFLNDKLIATIQWRPRSNGTIPKSRDYFTTEVAKYAPKELIKYYKSRMVTTTIIEQQQDC
ncbi:unnamed protein product (macronuclear) [Paramecium tetraurelia]|uniref:Chromosome undetermined scaffold_1, whole genome shotgun sequence n=1 Tax=Paramecium tetraurelia TaxID=5888 RepID=Q6BGD7_PARTE|nr:hypothetical protein [Paramecium tetraurelia strain d4-2]XP_001423420.1 uncharacterized protein GSPATT00000457001 [Paramecium tetraurelia]CAH03283.1 hypothetical protein PTMB.86 [Paramecium tetraurelia]CAK56022.1 unnamed protein product [Paramecium tetraurelia]|eukprot:XP_001423420.1 hypothetical protein (macronuclear) [Paramecium tetraurelia strain d4-2]